MLKGPSGKRPGDSDSGLQRELYPQPGVSVRSGEGERIAHSDWAVEKGG